MKLISAIKFLLVFLLFSVMSCDESMTEPIFTIGKESKFRTNQLYSSSDGSATFIIKTISDSRCPEDAICIWQGEISLTGEWIEKDTKTAIELHSVLTNQQITPQGLTMQLLDAKPYPKLNKVSKPDELVIRLLIKRE